MSDLSSIGMHEIEEDHPFFVELQTHVYHATSFKNYTSILAGGFLHPDMNNHSQRPAHSAESRAYKLKAISFFDFITAPKNQIFYGLTRSWWVDMLQDLGWPKTGWKPVLHCCAPPLCHS